MLLFMAHRQKDEVSSYFFKFIWSPPLFACRRSPLRTQNRCDCLGYIHYFDATLNDSRGLPYDVRKAVCMHEEDDGLLWKHVEYRNGHSESRRSRRLVLSFIATVVNYE